MIEKLNDISGNLPHILPELILFLFLLIFIILGMLKPGKSFLLVTALICFVAVITLVIQDGFYTPLTLARGLVKVDGFASCLKILMNISALLCCFMSIRKLPQHAPEYFAFLIAVVLGGHLLVSSSNFLMVFLSLELISIGSYVLAAYSFSRSASEGSLKYFLFGSMASAVMLYGFSILYGLTGTVDFSLPQFASQLASHNSHLALLCAFMILAGILYKIAAAPMHFWAPDVYEAAPVSVIAFLSIAPKLAGLGLLLKFIIAINLFGNSNYDWQIIMAVIAMLTITIGNFVALSQQNVKRLMAYSSIAQSGFLMIGIVTFLPQGIDFMLFYACIYMLMNFLVFVSLDLFEDHGISLVADFAGRGKEFIAPMIFLLVGLISLTGLPPTAGFTAKLFIFTGLWQSYELSGKGVLLLLLIFGLLNTAVSLFYYLRIPYFAFLKPGPTPEKPFVFTFQSFLAFILAFLLLLLFFMPGLLMGWINTIKFVF